MRANIFRDQGNTGYYVDPASTSILSTVYNYGTTYIGSGATSGSDLYLADRMYDWDNTAYYIDPNGTSITNDMRASIFYDRDNTGYYLNPAGYSHLSDLYVPTGAFFNNITVGMAYPGYSASYPYETIALAPARNLRFLYGSTEQYQFSSSGTARAGVGWTTYSDQRLKENVIDISNPLQKVMDLKGVEFDWKESGSHAIGVIAQDVEQIAPELVFTSEDPEQYKSVDYAKFTPLLIEATKEQQNLITTNTNNISLNATATSVSELQTLTEQEFTDTNGILNQVQDDTLTLQTLANKNANLISDIQAEINAINANQQALVNTVSTNSDTVLAVNENILFTTVADDKNIVTISGITVIDELKANSIETNILTVNDDVVAEDANGDAINASSIGTATILAGETEVIVETSSVVTDARIFVSPKIALPQTLAAEDIISGESFVVKLLEAREEDLEINWFIIN